MFSKFAGSYMSHRAWLEDVINDDSTILCGVSALEYLEMYTGFFNEKLIDVYAKQKGIYENINYIIVDNFDSIEYFRHGNLLCTTFDQTINDMLSDIYNADEAALTEALSNYYYSHHESFDGLNIDDSNLAAFEEIKPYAIDYYSYG